MRRITPPSWRTLWHSLKTCPVPSGLQKCSNTCATKRYLTLPELMGQRRRRSPARLHLLQPTRQSRFNHPSYVSGPLPTFTFRFLPLRQERALSCSSGHNLAYAYTRNNFNSQFTTDMNSRSGTTASATRRTKSLAPNRHRSGGFRAENILRNKRRIHADPHAWSNGQYRNMDHRARESETFAKHICTQGAFDQNGLITWAFALCKCARLHEDVYSTNSGSPSLYARPSPPETPSAPIELIRLAIAARR